MVNALLDLRQHEISHQSSAVARGGSADIVGIAPHIDKLVDQLKRIFRVIGADGQTEVRIIQQEFLRRLQGLHHRTVGIPGVTASVDQVVKEEGLDQSTSSEQPAQEQQVKSFEVPDPAMSAESLAVFQYRRAREHPNEFVVLVGTDVAFHSPDEETAEAEYWKLAGQAPKFHPVMVSPDTPPPDTRPGVRGRTAALDGDDR